MTKACAKIVIWRDISVAKIFASCSRWWTTFYKAVNDRSDFSYVVGTSLCFALRMDASTGGAWSGSPALSGRKRWEVYARNFWRRTAFWDMFKITLVITAKRPRSSSSPVIPPQSSVRRFHCKWELVHDFSCFPYFWEIQIMFYTLLQWF